MATESFACQTHLSSICTRLCDALQAHSVSLAVLRNTSVVSVAGHGHEWDRLPPIPLTESLISRVIEQRGVLALSDISSVMGLPSSHEARRLGIASFLGCSLQDGGGRTFGALAVHRREPAVWSYNQQHTVRVAASILTILLETGRDCVLGRERDHRAVNMVVALPGRGVVRRSSATRAAYDKAAHVAPSSCSVLITGETGSGKEVLAQYIHAASDRPGRFEIINCAAIPDELIESEMFGHVRGAFTGAVASRKGLFHHADRGTLFLDEVGDLSARGQAKLLRAIETGEIRRLGEQTSRTVDVRIVAATNRNLSPQGNSGFRPDLFYRLAECEIHLPPLRERREDLEAFIGIFLGQVMHETTHWVAGISDEAMRLLLGYSWPGNIRELKSVLRSAVLETPRGQLVPAGVLLSDLRPDMDRPEAALSGLTGNQSAEGRGPGNEAPLTARLRQDGYEERLRALHGRHKGNVSRIARELGVLRQTVQKHLRKLGLR